MTKGEHLVFESIYLELEGARVGSGIIQRRVRVGENVDVVAFLHTDTRLRGAALELRNQIFPVAPLEKVRGLNIAQSQLDSGPRITIEQARPGDGQLFTSVIESILSVFPEFPRTEGRATADKLVRWRAFFSRESEGLSREEQLGLFAELHVLRKIAKAAGTPVAAVQFWEGPHSEVHDFSQADWALEVKATSSLGSGTAMISSERQLEPSSVGSLYLAFFSFDVRPNGAGTTLPTAVSRTRRDLAAFPSSTDHFEDLLIGAGYHDHHASSYSSHYTVVREDGFLVSQGFPSIREAQLSKAISRVRYSLNLDLCQDWKMPLDEVLQSIVGDLDAD